MAYKRLGDMLIEAGALTQEKLMQALEIQKETGQRLGNVLLEAEYITEEQLIDALRQQLGVDYVDLSAENVNPNMADYLSPKIAKEHSVIPIRVDTTTNTMYLAMVDPLNFVALDEVKQATKMRVVPLIATASGIERTFGNIYGNEGAARALEELEGSTGDSSMQATVSSQTLEDDENAAPTIRLVNSIIERAVIDNCSDIHIEPLETSLQVRMRIDGVLRHVLDIPKKSQQAVISRIKVISNLDIAERRIPQDGRANVRAHGQDIDLRVSTLPTIYGEKVVIRLLFKNAKLLTLNGVGLDGQNIANVEQLLSYTNGVILIVGPTGSGKSSTMSAMITHVNTEGVNLTTLEDPVEYNIAGANQVQVHEKVGMTFAAGLRSILRQDPDIICVGEIRDGETAEIAMRSAITGHLVISTLHTNDSVSTIDRLIDMGTPNYLVSAAMRGVISQRLVRRICPKCKEEYIPSDEELMNVGISREAANQHKFYHGKGCPDCHDTGYRGRIACFEIMMITPKVTRAISKGADRAQLLEILKTEGFHFLKDDIMKRVLQGVTTLDEVFRTVSGAEED